MASGAMQMTPELAERAGRATGRGPHVQPSAPGWASRRAQWQVFAAMAAVLTLLAALLDWGFESLATNPASLPPADLTVARDKDQVRSPTLYSPLVGTLFPTLGPATVAVCAGKEELTYGLVDPCAPPPRSPLDP